MAIFQNNLQSNNQRSILGIKPQSEKNFSKTTKSWSVYKVKDFNVTKILSIHYYERQAFDLPLYVVYCWLFCFCKPYQNDLTWSCPLSCLYHQASSLYERRVEWNQMLRNCKRYTSSKRKKKVFTTQKKDVVGVLLCILLMLVCVFRSVCKCRSGLNITWTSEM